MNSNQKSALVAFAAVANWSILHPRSKDGFVKRLILLLKELFYNPEKQS